MQECTLQVEGCRPVFQPGVCCPVRYDCGKLYPYHSSKNVLNSLCSLALSWLCEGKPPEDRYTISHLKSVTLLAKSQKTYGQSQMPQKGVCMRGLSGK